MFLKHKQLGKSSCHWFLGREPSGRKQADQGDQP